MSRFNIAGYNKIKCSAKEHFEKKFHVTPGCWIWTAGRNTNGYGQFYDGHRRWIASRFAWGIYHGDIPKGLLVCHRCDNPLCVNPAHLFLGTAKDNADDCVKKGRSYGLVGAAQNGAKLTDEKVILIRSSLERASVLAALFGVRRSTIYKIRSGETWAHLLNKDSNAEA